MAYRFPNPLVAFTLLLALLHFQFTVLASSIASSAEDVYAASQRAVLTKATKASTELAPAELAQSNSLSSTSVPTDTTASGLQIRTFNPATLGNHYCGSQLPWWGYATVSGIESQISYLKGHTQSWCDAPAKTCVRVSCSYGDAVYLCNDNDYHIYVTCPDVAAYANWLVENCSHHGHKSILGQLFDQGHWDVIARSDSC